jgi:hypothetical protein
LFFVFSERKVSIPTRRPPPTLRDATTTLAVPIDENV